MANKTPKLLTLCFVHDHPRILLGMKKKGLGLGLWNGFGGKVEEDESIEDAAIREVEEEAGIRVTSIEKYGILEFTFADSDALLEVHVFKALDHIGKPRETDEMKPQWFYIDEIPFQDMWSDDKYWLPLLLKNRKFKGKFHLDTVASSATNSVILERELAEVDEI